MVDPHTQMRNDGIGKIIKIRSEAQCEWDTFEICKWIGKLGFWKAEEMSG